MALGWTMTMAAMFIGAASVVPDPSTSPSSDPAAAMARVATNLKSCESAPNNMNTMAQNGCYSDAVEAADTILKSAEGAILDRLAARSAKESESAKDNREIARRLEAAQRAWASYREAECSFAATEMLGGTGEAVTDMSCLFRESQARVKRLADWLKDNPLP